MTIPNYPQTLPKALNRILHHEKEKRRCPSVWGYPHLWIVYGGKSHFGFHLWHFIWPSQDLAVLKDKEEEHAWLFLNCSWLINDDVERFLNGFKMVFEICLSGFKMACNCF
jgi:hypothetical protein